MIDGRLAIRGFGGMLRGSGCAFPLRFVVGELFTPERNNASAGRLAGESEGSSPPLAQLRVDEKAPPEGFAGCFKNEADSENSGDVDLFWA